MIHSAPVFTLSLDCEGLWGMADNPALIKQKSINRESLAAAYDFLLGVIQSHGVRASAAFVTCFAAEPDLVRDNLETLARMARLSPTWFAQILVAFEKGDLDGWTGAPLYRAMSSAGCEMAWHGTTHVPLSPDAPPELIAAEVELASKLLPSLGSGPATVIFPRNVIGWLPELNAFGFRNYRGKTTGGKLNYLNEWNPLSTSSGERPRREDGWGIATSGNFLNWPSGPRALIPDVLTISRWKRMLRGALRNGDHVHMWFHPHNLITAPRMRTIFAETIKEVGTLVRSGDMLNLTIAETVERIPSGH